MGYVVNVMLTWILNNNTVRLSRANLNPRIEIRPSAGWSRLFRGLFLVKIEFKWLHERLNQTLVCRTAKLKLWCNLFTPFHKIYQATLSIFLVCNHVTRRPCWRSIQQNIFLKNLHENRVKFTEERNAFVFDLQYGRRDVTWKPAMASLLHGISPLTV